MCWRLIVSACRGTLVVSAARRSTAPASALVSIRMAIPVNRGEVHLINTALDQAALAAVINAHPVPRFQAGSRDLHSAGHVQGPALRSKTPTADDSLGTILPVSVNCSVFASTSL